jgi:hypothetical protein
LQLHRQRAFSQRHSSRDVIVPQHSFGEADPAEY